MRTSDTIYAELKLAQTGHDFSRRMQLVNELSARLKIEYPDKKK